jgi:hypothetical protein
MSGFDDLERQLRAKVSARAVRRRRHSLRTVTIAVCALVSVGTVTAAATGVIGRTVMSGADRVSPAEKLSDDLSHAAQKTPGCALPRRDRGPAVVSTVPAHAVTIRAFPQLRRPRTPRERAAARKYGRAAGAAQVLSGGARDLRATDGTRFLLIITTGRDAKPSPDSPRCLAVQRAELERRARGLDPNVLTEVRRNLDRAGRNYRASLGRERLLLIQLAPNGRLDALGGTYSDVAIHRGMALILGGRSVSGLVPAPADHVILRPRTRDAQPIRVEVAERVFHQHLPESFHGRVAVEWRSRDGRLLHVVRMGS